MGRADTAPCDAGQAATPHTKRPSIEPERAYVRAVTNPPIQPALSRRPLPLLTPGPNGPTPPEERGVPLLQKGFRPFFLLAAGHALLFVPAWVFLLRGRVVPSGAWPASWWHAHEMISGFALAVVAGFLLTAVENWTRLPTARGATLASLALLWLLGRLGFFLGAPTGNSWLEAIDALFPFALALAIGRPLWRAANLRNALFPLALLVLGGAEATLHMAHPSAPVVHDALSISLDVVLLFVAVVTGRIVPLFTRNATGERRIEDGRHIGRLGLVLLGAGGLASVSGARHVASGCFALAASLLMLRARRWGLRPALREPLLWVLHLGHGWLLVALVLRAVSLLDPALVPRSAWIHALGAGSIGLLTLGMMVRVALGHTGRPLRAPPLLPIAFGALAIGAPLRVAAAWLPAWRGTLLWGAAASWALAFGIYLVRFVPVLSRPRADGRPG